MYRILIVDDERWVAESIFQCIEWKEYSFEVIGIAYSGTEAFDRIKNDHPDIVLVDIRMPKMNGLELISKVNKAGIEIKFIIISGHADFSYAQKAMHENAVGYCLKPVNHHELLKLLEKARNLIDAKQNYKPAKLFDMLLNYSPHLYTEAYNLLNDLGLNCSDHGGILALVSHGDIPVQFSSAIKYIVSGFGSGKFVYLLQTEDIGYFLEQPDKHIMNTYKSIGIGQPALSVDALKKSLYEAYLFSYQRFICSERNLFKYIVPQNGDISTLVTRINNHIKNREIENAINYIQTIPGFLNAKCLNIKHAFFLFNSISHGLYESTDQDIENYLFNFDQLIELYIDCTAMAQALVDHVKETAAKPDIGSSITDNKTFNRILTYTTNNFSNDISLGELSKLFFTNPSYISQLFKKELGQNFTEYILSLRIKQACELIANENLTLLDISHNVGYVDYFYFSRVFKKKTGKTPSQYKEMLRSKRKIQF